MIKSLHSSIISVGRGELDGDGDDDGDDGGIVGRAVEAAAPPVESNWVAFYLLAFAIRILPLVLAHWFWSSNSTSYVDTDLTFCCHRCQRHSDSSGVRGAIEFTTNHK
ncbi:hypothetical protein KIN20_018439 [Parelaphostrongylus tenuis]|uniref:Uncharacterized protein n=1 Tax=Parelaphostrongylus tenuis TaxID=148309 RepID=A0AAD5N3P8_PARTN|nr:hypothetical protein KIN20_018439 [Parelaphostrongylus tenuis]